jgi:hypothetical protein
MRERPPGNEGIMAGYDRAFRGHARVVSGAVHTCAGRDDTAHCVWGLPSIIGQYLTFVLSSLLVATAMQ